MDVFRVEEELPYAQGVLYCLHWLSQKDAMPTSRVDFEAAMQEVMG